MPCYKKTSSLVFWLCGSLVLSVGWPLIQLQVGTTRCIALWNFSPRPGQALTLFYYILLQNTNIINRRRVSLNVFSVRILWPRPNKKSLPKNLITLNMQPNKPQNLTFHPHLFSVSPYFIFNPLATLIKKTSSHYEL